VVSYDEGFNCAKRNGMAFMECSAKSGQNIDAIFTSVSEAIIGKIDKGEIDPKNESIGIKLGTLEVEKSQKNKEKSCCQ
jgi:Ras-related protein Rab-2A